MPLKKGDILDEKKRYPESCGLMVKVMSGGAGFEKLICCDHDLTDEDIVPQVGSTLGRKKRNNAGRYDPRRKQTLPRFMRPSRHDPGRRRRISRDYLLRAFTDADVASRVGRVEPIPRYAADIGSRPARQRLAQYG